MALVIEKEMNRKDNRLSIAALLHDIGKIYVPKELLGKREHLSELEKEVIANHSYFGYRILVENQFDMEVVEMVLNHHSNNPDSLFADHDDIFALKTIDRYEALTTDRAYHRGLSSETAAQIIEKEGFYNKEVLEVLLKCEDFERV